MFKKRKTLHDFFYKSQSQIQSSGFDNSGRVDNPAQSETPVQTVEELLIESDSVIENENPKMQVVTANSQTKCRFLPKWYKEFPWITYNEKSKTAFCKVCKKNGSKVVMATTGTTNLQHSTFTRHETSNEHKSALAAPHLGERLKSSIEQIASKVSSRDEIIFRTIYMISKEEMAQRKYKAIMLLQKANGVQDITTDDINMHHRKISAIENAMSDVLIDHIDEDVMKSPYISILVDESTDVTITKKLIIFVKIFKNSKSEMHFWANTSIKGECNSDNITETILNFLKEKNIPLSKVLGFSTDGASVMMGQLNGVGVQLQKLNPLMLHIHCVAHKLALAVSQAANSLPKILSVQDIINCLCTHFNSSSVRHNRLKEMQEVLQQQKIILKHQHIVRWLSLGKAVEAIHANYDSVNLVLSEEVACSNLKVKKCNDKSSGLLKAVSDYSFIACICLLRDVLDYINKLSQAFQADELNFSLLVDRVYMAKSRLEKMKIHSGPYLKEFLDEYKKKNGYYKDVKINSVLHSESSFQQLKDKLLNNLVENLNVRFSEQCMKILKDFDLVLNPSSQPSVNTVDEAMENLIKIYCNKDFSYIYGDLQPQEERLKEEWLSVKELLRKYKGMKLLEFCKLIDQMTDGIDGTGFSFPEYRKLMVIGITLPLSTAACERGFSTQNRIKHTKKELD